MSLSKRSPKGWWVFFADTRHACRCMVSFGCEGIPLSLNFMYSQRRRVVFATLPQTYISHILLYATYVRQHQKKRQRTAAAKTPIIQRKKKQQPRITFNHLLLLLKCRPLLTPRKLQPPIQSLSNLQVVWLVLGRQNRMADHEMETDTCTIGLELSGSDRV